MVKNSLYTEKIFEKKLHINKGIAGSERKTEKKLNKKKRFKHKLYIKNTLEAHRKNNFLFCGFQNEIKLN